MKNTALLCVLLAACGGGGSGKSADFVPSSNIAATHDYLRGIWMGTATTSDGRTGPVVLNLSQLPPGPSAAGAFYVGLPEIAGTTLQLQAGGEEIRAESFPITFTGRASAVQMFFDWTSSIGGARGTMELSKSAVVVLR